jgi:hypothetical protein
MLEMIFADGQSYDSLSVGSHKALFKGIEPTETQNGKAWRWRFETLDGKRASELSDRESPPSPKNKTGRFLMALASKPFAPGDKIAPEAYVGKTYLLIVEPKGDGKTKISTFTAID